MNIPGVTDRAIVDANLVFGNNIHLLDSSRLSIRELFFPNMCHVCRCFGENASELKMCGDCEMISYCDINHQIHDWPRHEPFCQAICKLKEMCNSKSILTDLKDSAAIMPLNNLKNSADKLHYYRVLLSFQDYLKQSVKMLLERPLTVVENQMIDCPRVCAICFECNQDLLTNCAKCPQSSFCQDHLNDPSHQKECDKLLFCFYLKFDFNIQLPSQLHFDVKHCLSRSYKSYQPTMNELPSSMSEFIEKRLYDLEINGKFMKVIKLRYHAAISELFSKQLTLIFTIEKLGLSLQSMVIHLVGANFEEQTIKDWELIFHYIPQLCDLKLILIGPEMLSEVTESQKICKICQIEKKELTIETRRETYEKYCTANDFLKPDIIACFNPGFYRFLSWKKAIPVFNKGQCPLLVTAISEAEGLIEKDWIDCSIPHAKCIYCDFNPFGGQVYFQRNVILPLESKNNYLLVYEYLDKKNAN